MLMLVVVFVCVVVVIIVSIMGAKSAPSESVPWSVVVQPTQVHEAESFTVVSTSGASAKSLPHSSDPDGRRFVIMTSEGVLQHSMRLFAGEEYNVRLLLRSPVGTAGNLTVILQILGNGQDVAIAVPSPSPNWTNVDFVWSLPSSILLPCTVQVTVNGSIADANEVVHFDSIELILAKSGWGRNFTDEFLGSELNPTHWAHEVDCWGGGNSELQCYTQRPENVHVANGSLVITALRDDGYIGDDQACTRPGDCFGPMDYTSGRVRTKFSPVASFKYGRFVIRAKMPSGKGLWPALWMLPTDDIYGTWAASGEIDILELDGGQKGRIEGTLHFGGKWPYNYWAGSGKLPIPGLSASIDTTFHDYGFEWNSVEMKWFVDDYLYHSQSLNQSFFHNVSGNTNPYTRPGQPFDERFHILFNLAVGGGYLPDPDEDSWESWESNQLIIDSLRVYQQPV